MQRASPNSARRPLRRKPARPAERRPPLARTRAPQRAWTAAPGAEQPSSRPAPAAIPPRPRAARNGHARGKGLLAVGVIGLLAMTALCLVALVAGVAVIYGGGRILPGVQVAGVEVGGMSEAEAAQALASAWNGSSLILRDGARTWSADPAALGIAIDAQASAATARAWGRSGSGPADALRAITGKVALAPALTVDWQRLSDYLAEAKSAIDLPAKNAGVRLVNGQAQSSPAENGRALDIPATLDRLRADPGAELADGALDLAMAETAPAITDASALVAQANALLAAPFIVHGYDPIRDEWSSWTAPPEVWAGWIAATSDAGRATGLALSLDPQGPSEFLRANAVFGDERFVKVEEAVAAMQSAVQQGRAEATTRVWHGPTIYTVRSGQTLARIGEEAGIPYPYIQAANPGINADALYAGQTLNLPSRDVLVPLEPVPHKRIVISRAEQRMWAYENGQVAFQWPVSTGIASSPTAPGVFQVQSHELNAYGEQWNLYMPHFVGFYHPGPNVEVMNGFHGFPTSATGGYLLWTNDLGRPATYGCILLSLENAAILYGWAEEGVVVEVTP